MLRNYLKIGLRNLLKNKLFAMINISGMAISIASFLIIALYVYDELKFDKHVAEYDLKYRVYTDYFYDDGRVMKLSMIPPMVAPTMQSDLPEVEYYTRIMHINSSALFEVGSKKMTEIMGGYADPTIFNLFSLKLVEGDLNTALKEPNRIAISQTLAKKYFGDKPAAGQSIEFFNEHFIVDAVYADFSTHSHLQLNYLLSMETLNREIPERMKSWGWSQLHSYVKLKPGTDAQKLDEKLRGLVERHRSTDTNARGDHYIPHLLRLDKVHLYASDHTFDIATRGNAQTVYILSATAIFILVIAILNFINLSTARAISRVKEVGVRKVVGAVKAQLIYQFISESVIVASIALIIGGVLTELVLPLLNTFSEKSIPADIFLDPLIIFLMLIFALIIGVAAGAYPAFYISGYKPAQILSNKQSGRSGKTVLRKGLVVLQFILSFFLITAALVVSEQHTFLRTKDMGFNKDNVIVLPLRGDMRNNMEAVKNTFSNHPNVISASLEYGLPGEAYAGDGIIDKATNKDLGTSLLLVDHDYIKTMGLKLIAGRDFSPDFPADTAHAFIISESAAKMLGYADPKEALQHEISWPRWDNPEKKKEGHVIGVVKDFHLNSLKESVSPVVLHIFPFAYSSIAFRIQPENVPETIAHLEKTWKQFNSEWPFEYRFIDDNFDKLYKSEQKLATLFTFFTAFTIFVACLGLFGLVVYSTTQKYKEISIRKVLGAEESSLVIHLGKHYVLLIVIAFVIAIPFSYYAAHAWLERFAYRMELTPILFVKSGLSIIVISLLTVGIQSLKAARSNPVNALKEQ
ncbi:MAG TPA: FtsX-like permease family protein [Ohtaekwangia sp.]|nr:FtsX-like permease family protein [Ohtaekwangia sp.]